MDKAKQKSIKKVNEHRSETPGERLYTDISYISGSSYGGERYWVLIVDEATCFKWSYFLKYKNEMAETVVSHLLKMKNNRKVVKFLRCDNAGENTKIEEEIIHEKVEGVKMEFTAPNTPQYYMYCGIVFCI